MRFLPLRLPFAAMMNVASVLQVDLDLEFRQPPSASPSASGQDVGTSSFTGPYILPRTVPVYVFMHHPLSPSCCAWACVCFRKNTGARIRGERE